MVRVQPDCLAQIDALGASLGVPSRPEVFRRIVAEFFAARDGGRADEFPSREGDRMQSLKRQEKAIRESEFWRGKPEGAEEAVKRLYLTGAGDCGGPIDYDRRAAAIARRFDTLWAINPEKARSIDWDRIRLPD